MKEETIQIDLKKNLSEKAVLIEEANNRFCFAAAGLPGDRGHAVRYPG